MTKVNERIIKKVLGKDKKHPELHKVGYQDGYWYATNGYVLVRMENQPQLLPLFGDNEVRQPNYRFMMNNAAKKKFKNIFIPYRVDEIKAWKDYYELQGKHMAFKLGEKIKSNGDDIYLGVNPNFLIWAMETTKSNEIKVPYGSTAMIMEGNNLTWLIMPIHLPDYYLNPETMTEI